VCSPLRLHPRQVRFTIASRREFDSYSPKRLDDERMKTRSITTTN
jgi:hypothetical protein